MANYLLKFKGKYRILPQLDEVTHDFIREYDGSLCDRDIYISCQNGNMITEYGHMKIKDNATGKTTKTKSVWLQAYIPSKGRGHNILNTLSERNIEICNHEETDEEVCFLFKASDIDTVATLLKAKTLGADISPFSTKNLPKSDYILPSYKNDEYKAVVKDVPKDNLLLIHNVTINFLDVIQKRESRKNKSFDYKKDIKKKCMARQVKEYIDSLGYWDEYITYLNKELYK